MNWLYPGILGALALLAIPVIIHLFYFRRYKTVYFSDIRFLQSLKNETNRFRKVRNLLVLFLRMLALAMLVFAFAQPFLNRDEQAGQKKVVSIYLDNSYSMSGQYLDVPLLDRGIQKAREIIKAHSQEDAFQLIGNEMNGRQQILMNREEALDYIDQMELNTASVSLEDIYNRQKEAVLSKAGAASLYWISDFQKTTSDVSLTDEDSLPISLVPIQSSQPRNIGLDSAWFENPVHIADRNSKLVFRMSNYGSQDVEAIPLSLSYNEEQRPLGNYSIQAGEGLVDSVEVSIEQGAWQTMELKIGDYPVQFDDQYHLAFRVRQNFKVLAINEANNTYLSKLFSSESEVSIMQQRLNNLDFSLIGQMDLVVLDDISTMSSGLKDQLAKYVKNGGKLMLFPPAPPDAMEYNALINELTGVRLGKWSEEQKEIGRMNRKESAFQEVFLEDERNLRLPAVRGSYEMISSVRSGERWLLEFRDGASALAAFPVAGGGAVYLSASPLNDKYSDLIQMGEIIVPLIYNVAISSSSDASPVFTMGASNVFMLRTPARETDEVYHFVKEGKDIIPRQRRQGKELYFTLGSEFNSPGIYKLNPSPGSEQPLIAMNFSRKESNLSVWSLAELKEQFPDRVSILDQARDVNLASVIEEKNTGNWLWKYLLGAALIFLLLEALVLRYWK